MLTGRNPWLISSLLVMSVVGCENRNPLAPVNARQTRDPSGAYAKPLSSSTVQVSWTDSAPNEISFRIERSATSTGPWAVAGTTDRNVTSFDDAGRSSEQEVCYRVFAVFRNGLSNPSNTSCTIPPAAPTVLTATMVDHQAIDLAWTDNSAVEDGYYVERATAEAGPYEVVAFVAANTVTYRQNGLITNTTYWYRVRAGNDGGFSGFSNVASATPIFTVPAAPSGVSAVPQGSTVYLTWVDNATNEDGFRVERSVDGGSSWTHAQTLNYRNATSSQAYNGALEQTVCYRVLAYNAQGASVPSDMDCTASPAAPTELSAAAVDQPAIDLNWKDNSNVEDGYDVYRWDGITAYTRIAQLAANSTSYRDAAVNADRQYRYYVRAAKDGGGSYQSNIASAVVATVPPAAPSIGSVYPYWSSTAVIVYWADNSTNEATFRIERSTNHGASWDSVGTAEWDYLGFADGGLTPEVEVCYRVVAVNSAGDSPASGMACTVPPAGATNLTATWTPEGIVLNWDDNSNYEDTYEIVFYTICSEQPDYWFASLPPNTTSFLLGGVSPWEWCGDYPWVYVVVSNDGGPGDFSNGVYTGDVSAATAAGARVAPDASALIRRARVKP